MWVCRWRLDTCEISQIFVPTGDLWHKCSCVDFDVHGSTVSADGVFSLPRRPVKSQCLRQEVGACQDQPMMSWERKWVGPNVPRVIFMKVLRAARWNKGSKLSHCCEAHVNISYIVWCSFNMSDDQHHRQDSQIVSSCSLIICRAAWIRDLLYFYINNT